MESLAKVSCIGKEYSYVIKSSGRNIIALRI